MEIPKAIPLDNAKATTPKTIQFGNFSRLRRDFGFLIVFLKDLGKLGCSQLSVQSRHIMFAPINSLLFVLSLYDLAFNHVSEFYWWNSMAEIAWKATQILKNFACGADILNYGNRGSDLLNYGNPRGGDPPTPYPLRWDTATRIWVRFQSNCIIKTLC